MKMKIEPNRLSVLTDSNDGKYLIEEIGKQLNWTKTTAVGIVVTFAARKWSVVSYSYPFGDIVLEAIDRSVVIPEEPVTVAECTGASRVMTRAMQELFESGFGPQEGATPYYYKDKVIVARETPADTGNIVGLIAYRFDKGEGSLWVIMGWVDPSRRRQGIYHRLWEVLVKQARKEGAVRIEGTTHINNAAMRGFYNSVGRVETHVISSYKIPLE